MRKVLIGIVALVVLLMAAALVGPGLVDWNGYRDRIAREAEAATGRKLTIAGDIGLAMLPSPRLRVRDVRLANAPGAAVPDMVTLKALEIDVALWPLLTGAIDVTRVTLVEPVIELQTLPDGSGNWVMKPSAASPPPSAASGIDAAPRPASGGMAIRLEDVGIANGTLVWRDAGGTAERVERIDVKASAESLQGPFRLTGKAVLRGAPVLLDADVGRLDAQAATPLRARVTLEKAKAEATLVATLGPEAPSRRMEGTLKLAADSAAAAAAAILGDAAGLPAAAVAVDAGFLLEGGRVRAEPLTLKLDDTTATGRFEVAPDRNGRNAVALTLRSQRIDVDRLRGLIPARVPAAAPAPAVPPAAGAAPAKAGFTLPGDIAAKVDLTVDTVLARGQTLRNVRVVAQLAQGRLSIDRGGVQLPGPADLSVTGTLAAVQGQPQFDGRVQLTAQNLRTALAAWKAAPDGLPPDRLGRTSFQTRVKASPAQVELQDISLALDAAKATGSAALRLTERPTLTARLAVDRLDLDGYLRKPSGRAAAGAAAAPAVAPPAARGGFDPGVDLDIEVKVGQLVAGGQSARDVVAAGTLQAGTLALRQLSVADYAGASARVQGTVRDLGPGPSVDLVVSASGRDLGRVIGRGGASAAVQAQQPFAVEGKVAGD
ncbi:MAG: AsmA family protein, partial [Alphaproteobacteria bacterium]